jgi:hypothetical protein
MYVKIFHKALNMASMATRSQLGIYNRSSFEYSRELNIIFTDIGEEIDDEVVIDRICETSEGSTWIIICVPGASSMLRENAQISVIKRLERFRELFPYFQQRKISKAVGDIGWELKYKNSKNAMFYVGGPQMMEDAKFLEDFGVLYYKNMCEYHGMPFKLKIDNFIQIAPLLHLEPYYFEMFQIKNYIVMGDLENPNSSINLTKAIPQEEKAVSYLSDEYDLLEEYHNQQCVLNSNSQNILFIPTMLAREVPMPFILMEKLPSTLKLPLLKTAFEQCVGRVPSAKSYAKNISVVNHKTILNYLSLEQKEDILKNGGLNVIPLLTQKSINTQIDKFLKGAWGRDVDDLKYRKRLKDIAQAVFLITRVEYKVDEGFTGFNADSLLNREVAEENWNAHIKENNCDLTPCYDLLALIVKDVGYVPDVEEFKRLVTLY